MRPATVVVTGASSGIGRALALAYAAPGISLGLVGRDRDRLDAVAAASRAKGAAATVAALDVRDRGGLAAWLAAFDDGAPVDLLIAGAGVMEGRPPGGVLEPADAAHALMETNVLGVLNAVQPLLPRMMARRAGQVALIGSIAGFIPLPDSPSYCASKAAVLTYGLSLRALLARHGVRVSVVCPGYVETPMMLRENGPKPFKMPAEKAAQIIRRGLDRDKAVIAFPFFFALATRINGLLPDGLRRRLSASFRFTVSPRNQSNSKSSA